MSSFVINKWLDDGRDVYVAFPMFGASVKMLDKRNGPPNIERLHEQFMAFATRNPVQCPPRARTNDRKRKLSERGEQMDVYTPVALKLHAFGLERMQDPNWTGTELFDQLKRPVRRDGFLTKFQKDGLLYWLGDLLFRDYLVSDSYVEELRGEYLVWYLENYAEFLKHHGADKGRKSLARLGKLVTKIDEMYEEDEDKYWRMVNSERVQEKLVDLYRTLGNKNEVLLERVAPLYAGNYADRVFHDRELCYYLSQLIVTIGFDGMDAPHDTEPKQWMDRGNIPVWAKELVQARDRGHCAECRTAITLELEADDHFDHMVPLSRGGCNDIVNLQLLCDKCNLKKSNKEVPIYSSIPPYLRRYHREK